MPYKEKEIEKKYYIIGEVADELRVATSLIRFWESEFDNIKPKKNRKGNRQSLEYPLGIIYLRIIRTWFDSDRCRNVGIAKTHIPSMY